MRATRINYRQQSRLLEVSFDDGSSFTLAAEYLRVYSPSAEVRGHGPGQEVLQAGKKLVSITGIKPVGNYAIQPTFDDGHDTGIFSWEYLHELGVNQEAWWNQYLRRLADAGLARDPEAQVLRL